MKPSASLKTVFFFFLFTFCVRQPAIEDPSPEEVKMVNEIQEPEQSTTASSTEETTTSSNTGTTDPPTHTVSTTSVGGNAFERTSPIILGYFPS